jgi:hypothetical protein
VRTDQGPAAGSCGHNNEPSGPTKGGEFLHQLSVLSASEEDLCSMELFYDADSTADISTVSGRIRPKRAEQLPCT